MAERLLRSSRKAVGVIPCRFESCTLRKNMALNFFKKNKKEPENLKELLARFKDLEENSKKLAEKIESLQKEGQLTIQKVGIVRFNPFSEVGSDQSFSTALLDGNDSGIVITSLYTRGGNRVYGKPIKKGVSEYSLSEEEKEAIKKAISPEGEQAPYGVNKNNGSKKRRNNNSTTGGGGTRPC